MIMSLWSTGLPHVASMAQDGNGVISRQPRSDLTRSLRQSSGQQQLRSLDLPALQNAPLERQARRNEYVDVPGTENRRNNNESPSVVLSSSHQHRGHRSTCIIVSDNGKTKVLKLGKREVSRTSDEVSEAAAHHQARTSLHCFDSTDIIPCANCGLCCCDQCRPRTDPNNHTWLCRDRYECSAENNLEHCTCLCCVKGLFYHLADSNHDDYSWGDKPCSCGDKRCCLRWSIMGMISLVLPCLWCYLPGRGCISTYKYCFGRDGCKCREPDPDYEWFGAVSL
ncbi:protein sprouty homolog 2-like isoform X2 [Patiria miniata]|uniref:Sprouty n=1 Tax=Patiria miniata TaxID=46514 RepID=A0A914AHR6_PATMI|nr:protein sprouty homolog 2-like isoform X2 [Patiria miniata]